VYLDISETHIFANTPAFGVKLVALERSKQALSVATSNAKNGDVCTELRGWAAGIGESKSS
jgi:hypothetical protein